MKVQTFSVLVGSRVCNAACPYCVSKMTPSLGMGLQSQSVNWRNLEKSCQFAKDSGVSTVLLTGKGEPTLWPEEMTKILQRVSLFNFPFIELQTNGILLAQKASQHIEHLEEWYDLGLTTIAVSIVHYLEEVNRETIQPTKYMNLDYLIDFLHHMNFSVRLSCIMFKGAIDSPFEAAAMLSFAKAHGVEQLTLTPVGIPEESENKDVFDWVSEHKLEREDVEAIKNFFDQKGKRLLQLMHGAIIYDLGGQNVCLSNCLTPNPGPEEVRQLIFFPDGHLRYDWQYPGAILL